MVRDPWTVAAALFAFGMIAWVSRSGAPSQEPGWMHQSLSADADLRLISERSEHMRTER
jgi:hypothetical protein